jgi:hypothetical protein
MSPKLMLVYLASHQFLLKELDYNRRNGYRMHNNRAERVIVHIVAKLKVEEHSYHNRHYSIVLHILATVSMKSVSSYLNYSLSSVIVHTCRESKTEWKPLGFSSFQLFGILSSVVSRTIWGFRIFMVSLHHCRYPPATWLEDVSPSPSKGPKEGER